MSAEKTYGCCASVTVTLRIRGKGHWGGGATVAEVQKQGGFETLQVLDHMIQEGRKGGLGIEIVGKPDIGAVTWGPVE